MRWPTLFSISVAASICIAATTERVNEKPQETVSPSLQLNIKIEGEKFCSGDTDVYTQCFDLATRYTNTGKVPIAVFLGRDFAPRALVARSVEDLKGGRYEAENNGDWIPGDDGGPYVLDRDRKTERSVTLGPGESVEGKNSTAVIVRNTESAKVPGTIASGTRYLQVVMLVKVAADAAGGKAVRPAGRRRGFRWVSVPSEPIQFEVPTNPRLQDCSGPPASVHSEH